MTYEERYREAELAFQKLKSLTKSVPAYTWTPEYRELANLIHTLGRQVFYVEFYSRKAHVDERMADNREAVGSNPTTTTSLERGDNMTETI